MESDSNSSKAASKNIKLAMVQYVRSTVLAIPALPSLKEIEEISKKKRYTTFVYVFIFSFIQLRWSAVALIKCYIIVNVYFYWLCLYKLIF